MSPPVRNGSCASVQSIMSSYEYEEGREWQKAQEAPKCALEAGPHWRAYEGSM